MGRKVPEDAPIGTKVVLNGRYCDWESGRGVVLETAALPAQICGTWVVWVEGFIGCYALDGLDLADAGNEGVSEIKEVDSDE